MSPAFAADRLRRMLALVPWILAHPGTTLAELAQRFEVSAEELEADLALLPLCGLPPYTADRLIDVIVGDDGAVDIRLAEYFVRPLRLTPSEAVALLAAGRTLLAVPGSDATGPLATALDKLERALGARGVLTVDVGGPDRLERLATAAANGEQLELDYYSAARDELTTRVVDPIRVFHAVGAWYLAAYCHRAEADRLFRVDRVQAIRPTGQPAEPHAVDDDELADLVYRPDPSDPRVKLRLTADASWVAETVPTEEATPRRDGGCDVVLAVSGPAFLDRLLLQLGSAAQVVDPPAAAAARVETARTVLARYVPA